jgi:hypothetical protein
MACDVELQYTPLANNQKIFIMLALLIPESHKKN